jgi:RND family efflux transporter MFP subunit
MSSFIQTAISSLVLVTFSTSSYALEIAGKSLGEANTSAADMSARGVLVAGQSADIAAGMTGRLTSAPFKSGQYVKRGAILAEFDCNRQRAELKSRRAAHATQSLRHDNQAELLKMGAAGALDVSIARSERDQIAAEVSALEIAMKDCAVSAPFPGFVTAKHIEAHETAQAGQPLYSLDRAGTTEVSVIAPSDWAGWVKEGARFTFKVDETGDSISARVQRLSAVVDPVSQTIEITARLNGKHKGRPGMSGVALFEKK